MTKGAIAGAVVGLVANPASGRDIRRLVAMAPLVPTTEKVNVVERVLSGLGAVGVERVVSMSDASGLSARVARAVAAHRPGTDPPWPKVDFVERALVHGPADTIGAVEVMVEQGVRCIVALGGDGTSRVVASACGDTPLLAISTGTNNVFPEMREATTAGLAAGLVATRAVRVHDVCRRAKSLVVEHDGREELALVDVSVTVDGAVGARAVWDPARIRELFLASAEPDAVGLSAVGGLLAPLRADEPVGLHLTLREDHPRRVLAPIAPGLVAEVGVAEVHELRHGDRRALVADAGVVAIDGEREIELRAGRGASVTFRRDGPLVVDVGRTLRAAAEGGLFVSGRTPSRGDP